MVDAVLDDPETAPVPLRVRAALPLIRVLTLEPDHFGPVDVEAARSAGLSDEDILDAVHICVAFNVIDRIADAMAFAVPPEDHLRVGAAMMKRIGYSLPARVAALTRGG